MDAVDILIKPVISEKSMKEAGFSRYTFVVNKQANKNQIKKAVEDTFGVDVLEVKTLIMKGKGGRKGRKRLKVKEADFKKAMVTVKEGQKIDIFEMRKE